MTEIVESSNDTHAKSGHEGRGHSELGGSGAARWSQCTGCIFLMRTLPPQPSSKAALEGTKAHEISEVCLRDFLSYKRNGGDPEAQFSLITANADPKMVEAAEGYRDAIWNYVLEEALTGKACGVEDHFWFDQKLDMGGISDFWAVYTNDRAQRVGAICDFKYGFSYVDVRKNGQLAFYANALRRFVRSHGKDLDLVRVAVYQPRVMGHDAYRESVLSAKQLDAWEKKFVKAAHQIYVKQKPTYKIGDWCKFCPAQAICPKYAKELSAKAELSLVNPAEISLINAEQLSDEQLAKIITFAPNFEALFKSCRALGLAKHLAGHKLPGMKVVLAKGKRGWKDNETEIGKAFEAMGVDPWNKKLKGMGDIKRLLGGGKGADQTIAPYVKPAPERPVLVSAEDERPEVESSMDLLSETVETTESDE